MLTPTSSASLPDPEQVARPWLDVYPPGVPATWPLPPVPVTRLLDDAARDFPAEPAVARDGVALSWSALADLVDRFATVLHRLGVGPDVVVGVAVPGWVAGVVALFAAHRLGAEVVLVDHTDATLGRLALGGAQVVVAGTDLAVSLDAGRDELPLLQHVIQTTAQSGWPPGRLQRLVRRDRPSAHGSSELVHGWDELLADAPPHVHRVPVRHDATAVTVWDGADPVVLTHANLVAAAFQARLWLPDVQAGRERVLSLLSPATSTGLVLGTIAPTLAAATIVLADEADAAGALRAIDRERPTIMAAAPSDYRALLEQPRLARRDLTSLRVAISGGSPLPRGVAAEFERVAGGARLRQGHGHPAAPVTQATPIYGRAMPGAIGLPLPDTVACVVDEDGRLCPPGTVGHLLVHGPQVAGGAAREPAGWLHTGDLAEQSPEGVFRLVGDADAGGDPFPPAVEETG